MNSPYDMRLKNAWVTPFGNPRINGCLLLTEAYRSLSRPSSPNSSKASTMDPYLLDHITLLPLSRTPAKLLLSSAGALLCQRSHLEAALITMPDRELRTIRITAQRLWA